MHKSNRYQRLTELVEFKVLDIRGEVGAGIAYVLIGSQDKAIREANGQRRRTPNAQHSSEYPKRPIKKAPIVNL